MGVVERVGDRAQDAQRPFGLELAFLLDQLSEVLAFDVAHGDVEDPVGFAGVEDRDDVRVVEARCELGLAQEALAEPRVVGELGREQLERRPSLQADLLGQVDDAHAAPADQPLDPVAREDRYRSAGLASLWPPTT